jgi:thiopurine S-methyltransferase
MEAQFWLDKWQANQIGFHESVVHPMLSQHWDAIARDNRGPVFVPLCGKSNDMTWLLERGHEVVGVELSAIAAQSFFVENRIEMQTSEVGKFRCYKGGGYTILCGDIFDITRQDLPAFSFVYDRAALIALPPATRLRYISHLRGLCPVATRILLVALSYPENAISPPPFDVPDQEIEAHYGQWCDVAQLGKATADVKGVVGCETAYCLEVLESD